MADNPVSIDLKPFAKPDHDRDRCGNSAAYEQDRLDQIRAACWPNYDAHEQARPECARDRRP